MKKYFLVIIIIFAVASTNLWAQRIYALKSENSIGAPRLQWYTTDKVDSTSFSVYRTAIKTIDFQPVSPLKRSYTKGDTLFFLVADTTLTEKALYQYFITLPYHNDSVARSEILYAHNMGILPSPKIVNFKAESAKDKKAINLSWKLNYNFSVNTISIFRSTKYDDGYELLTRLSGDAEKYTDRVETANEAYYYYFIIHDYFGYQSPSVRYHGISTYKEKPLPPFNAKISNTENIINLSWKRLDNNIVGYKVYRRINQTGKFYQLDKMFYTPENQVTYTDTTVKALKNKDIEYYIVAISDGFVESSASDTLLTHIKGEILKSAPKQCDFVFDSLNRIMLIWTSQENDPEVKGYNVYKTDVTGNRVKLNNGLIAYNINYFIDENNTKEKGANYEVETVSITNTPSINRATVKVNNHYLTEHLILSLDRTAKGISIKALPLSDKNIKEILLFKQTNTGKPKKLATLQPNKITFTDINVKPGEIYNYSALAVYKDKTQEVVNGGVIMRY